MIASQQRHEAPSLTDQLGSTRRRALNALGGMTAVFRRKRYSVGLLGLCSGKVTDLRPAYTFRSRRRAVEVVHGLNRLDEDCASPLSSPVTRWVLLRNGDMTETPFWRRLISR